MGQGTVSQASIDHAGSSTDFGQGKHSAEQFDTILNQHRNTVAAADTLLFKAVSKLICQGIKLRPVKLCTFTDNRRFFWVFGSGLLEHQAQGAFGIISWGLKEY